MTAGEWIDGFPPDMGDAEAVWIVAEIPAFFGSGLVRYQTFVWYGVKGEWCPKSIDRASRWMRLTLPD